MAYHTSMANGVKSAATTNSLRISPAASAPAIGMKRKRTNDQKFYAVREGKSPGIYNTWEECLSQVKGHRGALFKAFSTLHEAQAFVRGEAMSPYSAAKQSGEEKYYAVQVGKVPGVYTDWPSAQLQIQGVKGPKYKKFPTKAEAEAFVAQGRNRNPNGADTQLPPEKKQKREMINRSAPGLVLGSTYTAKDVDGNVFETGSGPLPPGAKDGFDPNVKLNAEGRVVHKTEDEKQKTKMMKRERDPSGMLIIHTDGSSLANGTAGARAGVGVYFGPRDPRNVSEALKGTRQTNQRAELTAISRALDIAPRHRDVTIYTDSRYSIDCVTNWYKNWMRNGWLNAKGKPVENKDLIADVREKIEERDGLGRGTYFVWVKGHANNPGNVAADQLAIAGARLGRGISPEVEAKEAMEKAIASEEKIGDGEMIFEDLEAEEAVRAMDSAMKDEGHEPTW